MPYELITSDWQMAELCRRLDDCSTIGLDTEFVSEHTYRPQLCLVQLAYEGRFALVDPLAGVDCAPLWPLLAVPGRETVVHAGRQEMLFCLEATGQPPASVFDVQLGAGFVGTEYPAGYGGLISRLLGVSPPKGETRSDWRRRPLSDHQLDYAVDDVRYLLPLRRQLGERLEALGRTSWYEDEVQAWLASLDQSHQQERWRRVSGGSSLSGRGLAVLRELAQWRDSVAQQRDCPTRQVLRDDLLVEIAKRRSSDPKRIQTIRGMERGDYKRMVPEIAAAVQRGLEVDEAELPPVVRSDTSPQLTMLGQFLGSALSSICRDRMIAHSLVGTAQDIRDLVAYRLAPERAAAELPALAQGWRAEVVGHLLDDLLAGRVAIRIANPRAEQPLVFDDFPFAEPALAADARRKRGK